MSLDVPSMEKLLVLRFRMAERKRRIAQACHSLDDALDDHLPLKKRRLAKKTVRFNEEGNTVLARLASEDDLRNSWLQRKDFNLIRAGNRATLVAFANVMGNVNMLSPDEFCVRGLEEQIALYVFHTPRDQRRKFSNLILVQHKFQLRHGFVDADSLRKFSVHLSAKDRAKALKIAATDAFC
jgi:hypothetical protein